MNTTTRGDRKLTSPVRQVKAATTPANERDERRLRSASLIDMGRIAAHPVAIVGVGAIGSHLAEMLAKLGVGSMTLIDPDSVDIVNLGVQGFHEADIGQPKAAAVAQRIRLIDSGVSAVPLNIAYAPALIEAGSVVFSCVDRVLVRRTILRDFRGSDWAVLFDGRMAAESLRAFCVERRPDAIGRYEATLFPSRDAYREGCTARATIYCASMAAAILCALFKQWSMGQEPEAHIQFDMLAMDCFR